MTDPNDPASDADVTMTRHKWVTVDGMRVFYREAGPADAPLLLLPHGFPCSSYEFRNLMPALADRWRTIAADFPGFGYSDTPDVADFDYTFDSYAEFLSLFTRELQLDRYAIYLHDYGSQFGLRLAVSDPEKVTALIISNGDIYEDQHGPKYDRLKEYWNHPTPEGREQLSAGISEAGFRDEFIGEVDERLRDRITPDLWTLAWAQLGTPERRETLTRLLADQRNTVPWFTRQQAYLGEHRPPTLIVWGPQDGYMPEGAARAYLRDLPSAELHLLDGGHWLLETHLDEVVSLIRDFLHRTL